MMTRCSAYDGDLWRPRLVGRPPCAAFVAAPRSARRQRRRQVSPGVAVSLTQESRPVSYARNTAITHKLIDACSLPAAPFIASNRARFASWSAPCCLRFWSPPSPWATLRAETGHARTLRCVAGHSWRHGQPKPRCSVLSLQALLSGLGGVGGDLAGARDGPSACHGSDASPAAGVCRRPHTVPAPRLPVASCPRSLTPSLPSLPCRPAACL
jgi:hypothetical protein